MKKCLVFTNSIDNYFVDTGSGHSNNKDDDDDKDNNNNNSNRSNEDANLL